MCLRNVYYPLVKLKDDDKRKVLFNYGIKIENRESFNDLVLLKHELRFAKYGSSKYQSLNKVFKKEDIFEIEKMVQVPCGCCRECMNDISRQWAFRILKEASLYDNNYFITFTFNDENLPKDKMLDSLFYQAFNKNFKNKLRSLGLNSEFRFYGVGEYGSKNGRPHYHCIYFNLDIPDLKFEYCDKRGFLHFSSKIIESLWNKGFIDIGSVDVGSVCYVARYCEKKKRLNKSEKQELLDKGIVPEFSAMSRRPGIGAFCLDSLVEDFKQGIFSHFIKGSSYSLPLYYSKKIKEILKGTDILKAYEMNCINNSMSKINQYLEISDKTNLTSYLESLDKISKRKL